jgi:proliferating cell nuclear antigen
MLLKFDNPKILADSISLISELVLEVKAKIKKDGFEIVAIDPANVAMIVLKIPNTAFSQFEVEKDEELGLNLEDFKQVLKRAISAPSIILEKKDNLLNIRIQDAVKRSFNLALIHIDSEDKNIPDLSFNTQIEIDSSTFSEIINDATIVADSCAFIANEHSFTIEARGTINSTKTEFSGDEVKIATTTESKAKYSLDYLVKFMKATKMSEKTILRFSTNYPSKFEFKNNFSELSFILAPRFEEE